MGGKLLYLVLLYSGIFFKFLFLVSSDCICIVLDCNIVSIVFIFKSSSVVLDILLVAVSSLVWLLVVLVGT